jgi:phage terminase large subunit-like protein
MAKIAKKLDPRADRRSLAESSLAEFIKLVHPNRVLGSIHLDTISWWTSSKAKSHQLLLLPRDHMKSALIAYRVAWELTKDPTLRVLYISSTSNLATKQLKFIKDIFTNDTYRLYWPDMVAKEEAKREKWTEKEISLDHPLRKTENIREPSVFTAGLTTNITGLHCDIAVLDDVVVQGNAYLEDGREKVREQYGYLSSIETANAREWVVGTRYHPKDLYSTLLEMEIEEYDELGNVKARTQLFEVKEHTVESAGDGTGQFLWPRQQRSDGKWFGFDDKILAQKRAQYLNKIHFRAQYYNDPHDIDSSPIQRSLFQYYDPNWLSRRDGAWTFKGARLNVLAAVDFAYSTGKTADASCVVVIGVDGDSNFYILDIDRFKTAQPSVYFEHILKMYEKWGFRQIRAEVSVAQQVLVNDLKDNYIRPLGLSLSVDEYRPSRWQGSKEERILAVLEPKYANKQIYHYAGGNTQILEEELTFSNPAHDDVKDTLASVIDFAQGKAPMNIFRRQRESAPQFQFHSRWGGVA